MYSGHAPFDMATKTDLYYGTLVYGSSEKFWQMHLQWKDSYDEGFKNLVTMMLHYNPANRPTIADVIGHPWLRNEYCATPAEVREEFTRRHEVNKQKVWQLKE